ncbi:MAG: hypothetical protein CM1200mP2_25110 [Planctomycetaceae bacterium]|nr:MAG: hypothetical protein CM1200mP2_25110 [Planctomycetaceae bacterium]
MGGASMLPRGWGTVLPGFENRQETLEISLGTQAEPERSFPVSCSPTVSEEWFYVGDEDGVFHAVDRKTGKKRWVFKTQAEVNSLAAVVGDV